MPMICIRPDMSQITLLNRFMITGWFDCTPGVCDDDVICSFALVHASQKCIALMDVVNPCTNQVIETTRIPSCYPTTDSNVPGKIQFLCWNSRLQTWYPRQRLTMNNSTNKWPQGYKFFRSANEIPSSR
jgi:hypothetical protein